jgi:peptide/nickel transport system substrate-binding protein
MLDSSATVAGSQYTYVPNPYYNNKSAIHFSKIIYKVISDPASALAALETGQVDATVGDPSTYAAAQAAGFKIAQAPASYFALHFMDLGGTIVPALANAEVREAMNYAINRAAIAKNILGASAKPTSELPMTSGFDPKVANYYTYNPAKAKQLLAQAGYPNGFSFTMIIGTAATTQVDLAQAVAQNLAAVGITATVVTGTYAEAFGGTYPVWACDPCGATPWPQFYNTFLVPKSLIQQHGWSNPTLASLYTQYLNTGKDTYLTDMAALTVTRAFVVPVAEIDLTVYYSKHLSNVTLTLANSILHIRDWTSN